jgi:hypothetical protein
MTFGIVTGECTPAVDVGDAVAVGLVEALGGVLELLLEAVAHAVNPTNIVIASTRVLVVRYRYASIALIHLTWITTG